MEVEDWIEQINIPAYGTGKGRKNLMLLKKATLLPIILFCFGINGAYCQTTAINNYEILTPKPGPKPRINGPIVYGCRPGHPFIYRIPCQGNRPIMFTATGIPKSLRLDAVTGIISGTAPAKGEYQIILKARNKAGSAGKTFKIISGDKLALTPPMGWNDWYAYFERISDPLVRQAADAMLSSGMADVGYQYVNIDDCWANKIKGDKAPDGRKGDERDAKGNILPNSFFPDMKKLTNYIHSKGLKAGIYSSPGPSTCGGYTGSYQHEQQDAKQFANWGFDFLKYDWCSYGEVAGVDTTLVSFQKPYRQMGLIVRSLNRDVVFNLCQYGMGDVWKWGASVNGNAWRTAGDLGGELDKVFDVALRNAQHGQYSKPGEWNDPDYIQIGYIGDKPELTKMAPSMQYAYMSLWCLMASPLFYSGDMSKLDAFTLNVLCNPDVIAIDQDPLGESAQVIIHADSCFLMVKKLADGSKAVGLFNHGKKTLKVTANWNELHLKGAQTVRDLWREKKLGVYDHKFSAIVPAQGVVMVQMIK
jgi:alpha-galactosidase